MGGMSSNGNKSVKARGGQRRRVLLLRHAKSSWDDPQLEDYDRPLAPRGRRTAALIGIYLADERIVPDLVLCSGARRARETWTLMARALARRPKTRFERELYLAAPTLILA